LQAVLLSVLMEWLHFHRILESAKKERKIQKGNLWQQA